MLQMEIQFLRDFGKFARSGVVTPVTKPVPPDLSLETADSDIREIQRKEGGQERTGRRAGEPTSKPGANPAGQSGPGLRDLLPWRECPGSQVDRTP